MQKTLLIWCVKFPQMVHAYPFAERGGVRERKGNEIINNGANVYTLNIVVLGIGALDASKKAWQLHSCMETG